MTTPMCTLGCIFEEICNEPGLWIGYGSHECQFLIRFALDMVASHAIAMDEIIRPTESIGVKEGG